MNLDRDGLGRSSSPASSGRNSPIPVAARRAAEDELYKGDKTLRRYAAIIERTLASWENNPQEWADYIAFLSRLLKAIQAHPKNAPFLPHSAGVASKLAQCLNPSLPSGVHQKALDVYAYIFSLFGPAFLSTHLHEYIPGLSGVLSFASLSVKPGIYALFEKFIVRLPSASLRSPLKALILGLLPAIEEATSEDFEEALNILEALEKKFVNEEDPSEHDGYFWQCIFLSIISSPSKRQGALNFLMRRLPRFTNISDDLSSEAEAMVSPDPGLLIRCFVAGLSDSNALVQRGFLDLLITHLPLHSIVLQKKVGSKDLDRLILAVIHILLRRDMSLNRRLWTWFLGPDPKESSGEPTSPGSSRSQESRVQLRYFASHGKVSLERCIFDLFKNRKLTSTGVARPFRICLSLMDRWEIGASVVPQIFMPAMETAFAYSKTATPTEVAEVVRSASLFFDGVEASLIFANLVKLLREALEEDKRDSNRLRFFIWIVTHFNVRDEEMVTTHIPYTLLYLFGTLNNHDLTSIPFETWSLAIDASLHLLELVPSRVFSDGNQKVKLNGTPTKRVVDWKENDIRKAVTVFYEGRGTDSRNREIAFSDDNVSDLLRDQTLKLTMTAISQASSTRFSLIVPVVAALLGKSDRNHSDSLVQLKATLGDLFSNAESAKEVLPFPTLQATVTLLSTLNSLQSITKTQSCQLEPGLTKQLWHYICLSQPKYQVEAVRSLWQLGDIVAPEDSLTVSLLELIRGDELVPTDQGETDSSTERFALLWNHSVPTRPGLSRKGSNVSMTDADHLARRLETLGEPLLLVLDGLHDPLHPEFEFVKRWLLNLPSLEQILKMLLARIQSVSATDPSTIPDPHIQKRHRQDCEANLEYLLGQVANVLTHGNSWTWDCLSAVSNVSSINSEAISGLIYVAKVCIDVVCQGNSGSISLTRKALSILDTLVSGPDGTELQFLEIDSRLISHLTESLESGEQNSLQGQLLQLTTRTMRLRMADASSAQHLENIPRNSVGGTRSSISTPQPKSNQSIFRLPPAPPTQLLKCLRLGIGAKSSRRHMHQWLAFLQGILPTFSDAIFSSLISLVEGFCEEVDKAFIELVSLTTKSPIDGTIAPDTMIVDLLDGLEMILAKAHDCLVEEMSNEPQFKLSPQTNSFLGNVTSGVFKAEAPPSQNSHANSRLTVILAFQDAIRVSLRVWAWASHVNEEREFDQSSAATTNYSALKVRNKTRQLLEQISTVEPLESLEVMILQWSQATTQHEAAATLNLLQVMHGSRPKNTTPAILDALCSRANPSALPVHRLSSQTVDLSAVDVASFLIAYLESTEDDAMDEVWNDCIAFLRDVLSNPLPYRQVLAALLSITVLLAKKVGNTNFGEQRKMRRELSDIFQRLLAATFTTLPSGFNLEPTPDGRQPASLTETGFARRDVGLIPVMTEVVSNLELIVDSSDRATTVVNSISSSIISPLFHSKLFPKNVGLDILALLLEMAKKAPNAKPWKKDLTDAFNDAKILQSTVLVVQQGWFPVLLQWSLRDKERFPELLGRLTPPSSAGIMFGVGATAARLDADRKTQLNIRRICLLLLASPEDAHVAHLQEMQAKLVELFDASNASSPSAVIKAELFMLCRALFLSTSSIQLSSLWPIINENLQEALISLIPNGTAEASFTNLALFQACKLLDQLVVISPDDFQLHEWLYITDTTDAVYQPTDFNPTALSDQVAEALGSGSLESSQTMVQQEPQTNNVGERKPLLSNGLAIDKEDIKAMAKDDFARVVLRPFLSQLSMLAYEGVYSMDSPDLASCRQSLLEDLLDPSTIVE
ncbi:Hypothetical protein R9X50_00083800 [Acrodontium crateriforme]|uniref:Dopey N-terminal domain-containing protein n=1 Tax=Acrodontium crateriforme TaxID=150365 RepID=A0AAQ3LY13_9PEZI|nr:Hypothetical protein R9X50_00083800 [Acrodontium crateriforme]